MRRHAHGRLRAQTVWSYGYGVNATTEGAGYAITAKTSTSSLEEFYVAGYLESPVIGQGRDIHVVAIDENGNLLSSETHGTPGDEEARWLAVSPVPGSSDNLFLTGSTDGVGAGLQDAFILELRGTNLVTEFTVRGGTGADRGSEIDVYKDRLTTTQLPLVIRNIAPLSLTTGSVTALCGALPD